MQYTFTDRLKHAWNVFKSRDPTQYARSYVGGFSEYNPDFNRRYYRNSGDRSIVTAIKNRIAVDAAQVDIQHVKLDDNDRYLETLDSGLNRCLSVEANIDQTGRAFRLDIFFSLLDEGVIALVPIDTTFDPEVTGTYQINSMRVGRITQWHPKHVHISVYNEDTGRREEMVVPKKVVAIVENPFYAVMNEHNSTFQRLIHKLALLDAVDEQSSSGKLDLIIQLPYVVKTPQRKALAQERRKEIEQQLSGSKYGVAWTDGTEKIQQLNRPIENNLLSQIQYLTDLAYSQLGITADILNGTADEKTMLNYNNRIIEPLVAAVADSIKRTFLTKTAITQHQSIEYYRDPFALVPVEKIAEIADKFGRNEITTSNEIRQAIGMKPSTDPNADILRNKNLYDTTGQAPGINPAGGEEEAEEEDDGPMTEEDYLRAVSDLDDMDEQLDNLEASLRHFDDPQEAKEYRRWYYENVEKENRKLGYGNASTKGLNEEGRAYAKYIRELFGNERKAKVADSKARQDDGIESSKSSTNEGIEKSKTARDTLVGNINASRDSRIESERTKMNAGIEKSQSERDSRIASVNEERDKNIESERTRTKSEIESHKNSMQMKIDTLKNYLSGLSKEDKAAVKERVQQEISDLREDNKQKRTELQEAFKATSAELRTEAKTENDAARQGHKDTSSSLREEFKTTSGNLRTQSKNSTTAIKEAHQTKAASLREQHKQTSAGLREEHKANTAKAKQEYEDAYAAELEYIKSLPEYQAVTKSKSSGSKAKSTTVVYKGKKNL